MEEELAEEERAAGQTERGKGSIGPGCPGEEEPLLQKSPHQASSSRPGPLRGVLQSAQRSPAWTKGIGTASPWQRGCVQATGQLTECLVRLKGGTKTATQDAVRGSIPPSMKKQLETFPASQIPREDTMLWVHSFL